MLTHEVHFDELSTRLLAFARKAVMYSTYVHTYTQNRTFKFTLSTRHFTASSVLQAHQYTIPNRAVLFT